jgi:hypothetical protein
MAPTVYAFDQLFDLCTAVCRHQLFDLCTAVCRTRRKSRKIGVENQGKLAICSYLSLACMEDRVQQ